MKVASGASDARIEVISLTVNGHHFCIDISSVRELRGWTVPTPLPQAPDFVLGVINLRGAVMPVLDLKARLGLGPTEITSRHVVIVIQDQGSLVGLVADEVQETVMIAASELQPPPIYFGDEVPFVDALVPRDNGILGRLNVQALLPPGVHQLAAPQAA